MSRKIPISRNQMYWLGCLTGYYIDNDGKVMGSRGCADIGINPGRIDGGEHAAKGLEAKALIRWIAGRGYAATTLGVEQWNIYHPNYLAEARDVVEAHEPKPRKPRAPKKSKRIFPRFTIEEVEAIRDRFEFSNDDIGKAITAKARAMLDLIAT